MLTESYERLEKSRRDAGYRTAAAAADAFGWNANTYRSIENGTRKLTPEWAVRCGKAFKKDASWLLYGIEGKDSELLPPADSIEGGRPRTSSGGMHEPDQAPVYGYVSGAHNYFKMNDGEPMGFRPRTPYMGANGFFVIVHGDSMEPLFEEGDELEVNPDMPLVKGKPCVIETINNEAMIKLFVGRNDRELTYKQLNPLEEKKLTMQNYVNVYRVVGKRY